jgi:hypothetical protein
MSTTPHPHPADGPAARPAALGCSAVRAALGEPLHGSAPEAFESWLLIEHPGPWPAEAANAPLPRAAAWAWERALDAGVRPQLIRRTRDRRSGPHQVYLASTAGGRPWVEGRELDSLEELAALDADVLSAVADGIRPGFGPVTGDRLLLVCTHGRQDPCCARYGRPVARALADAHGPAVWETTHVGGDRYAANVVCLPDGTYHGGTDPASALAVAAAALRGEVDLDRYRGRAGLPSAAQSAEWYARRETGILRADDVRHLGCYTLDAVTTLVGLVLAGEALAVTVRRVRADCPRMTSCAEGMVDAPEHHVLLAIESAFSAA